MRTFARRLYGAALLDRRTYEDVEADRGASGQAVAVVLLSSLASGLAWIGAGPGRGDAFVTLSLVAVAGWVTWALLTYAIGTRWFPEPQTRADAGELLRTLGFAQSPALLRALGVVGGWGPTLTLVTAVWTIATTVVAVRQALDYTSTGRAVLVCVTGWGLAVALFAVIGMLFASPVR